MKKLLLISSADPFESNGAAANRYSGLILGLLKFNVKITIVVVGKTYVKRTLQSSYNGKGQGLEIIHLLTSYVTSKITSYLHVILPELPIIISTLRIKKYIASGYDIVWIGYDLIPLSIYCHYHNLLNNVFFIELNEYNDVFTSSKDANIFRRRCAKKENKYLLKCLSSIDSVATMTKTLEKHYRKLTSPKCEFIHLPMTVNLSRFEQKFEACGYLSPYIAFIGSMSNDKDGVDVLIKAFTLIANKYPNLQLYLAGFWHYDVPKQDEMIERYGLGTRVHRLGVLTSEQIPPFVCKAKLLALARPESHQAQGGFPTKLGEYLATGNPVCVTKVGEIPNYLEDNISAFMADPGDAYSFANALDRALSDEERAKEVGHNGRIVAEQNFSSELQAGRLFDFFQNIISK